jgi:hypothetical protein
MLELVNTDRNLRDELRQAIESRDAAEARLNIANDILAKAEREALNAGGHEMTRLQQPVAGAAAAGRAMNRLH